MAENFYGETSTQQFETMEQLREKYKKRLDEILFKQLTVDNISSFADDALEGVVTLTKDILEQYKSNLNFVHAVDLNDQAKEDDAFKKLNLPNLQIILQSIIDIKTQIDDIQRFIQEKKIVSEEVIIPPQDGKIKINSGIGSGVEKGFIPRLVTLIYILEHDFDIPRDGILIIEGSVEQNMVRQTPYVCISVEALNRVVYICDEEGNASYIFDTQKLKEHGISLEQLSFQDKRAQLELIYSHPGIGRRIIQTPWWRSHVSQALGEEIQVDLDRDDINESDRETIVDSEFKEKKVYLPYDDFEREVRENYDGESAISVWYKKVRKLHRNWPALPDTKYKNAGWKSWPELVGYEKRERIDFAEFKKQVKVEYKNQSNIGQWYSDEYDKHKGWPSSPDVSYKHEGWISWANLLDLEEINHLPFEEFQKEVRALYVEGSSITRWYREEQKKHKNWPSSPNAVYKKRGWTGWLELFGKERVKFLEFREFKSQVASLYPGSVAVGTWYDNEKENHKDWPKKPDDTYAKTGWIDWFELVGKERPKFLSYKEFKDEMTKLYKGESNVSAWYELERKKHDNWPSDPAGMYEDDWKGWPELLNIEKVESLSFDVFSQQVKEKYPGTGSIEEWYKKERQSHADWPGTPESYYDGTGWKGWKDLVDRKFVDFTIFKKEVMEAFSSYKGDLNIQKWYQLERKNHKRWPSNPDSAYKYNGWKNWKELTGVEKIKLLSLQELKQEVGTLYPKTGDIKGWYDRERRNHKSWPSTPSKKYKNDGWISWGDLVLGNDSNV